MPALTVDTNTLTGDGVVAAIAETRKGTLRTVQKIVSTNVDNGTFTLTYGGQTTTSIYAGMNITTEANSANDVKYRLEALSTIGRVATT